MGSEKSAKISCDRKWLGSKRECGGRLGSTGE